MTVLSEVWRSGCLELVVVSHELRTTKRVWKHWGTWPNVRRFLRYDEILGSYSTWGGTKACECRAGKGQWNREPECGD